MKFKLAKHLADRTVWLHERVGYVDLFLSPEHVRLVIEELKYAYWQPSPTYEALPDGTRRNIVNRFRSSESAYYHWFSPKLLAFLANIDRQISTAFGFASECLEPWQATRYKPGGSFEFHRDSGYWADDPAGERVTTFLLHLVAADAGGSTSFRALGFEVAAAPGRLVFWLNLNDNGQADHRMIHSGTPVEKGTKVTLATWQRQHPFPRFDGTSLLQKQTHLESEAKHADEASA
jgi:hypothetical protein